MIESYLFGTIMSGFQVPLRQMGNRRQQDRGEGEEIVAEEEDSCCEWRSNKSWESVHGSFPSAEGDLKAGRRSGHGDFFTTMSIGGRKFPYFACDDCDDACFEREISKKLWPEVRHDVPAVIPPISVPKPVERPRRVSSSYKHWSLEDLLECLICRDVLIEATTANCGHSFCSACLQEWLKHRRWCPICQEPVRLRVRNLTLDRIADHVLPRLSPQWQHRFEAAMNSRLSRLRRHMSRPKVLRKTFLGRCWLWTSARIQGCRRCFRYVGNKGLMHGVGQQFKRMLRYYVEDEGDDGPCNEPMKLPSVSLVSPLGLICIGVLLGWVLTSTELCPLMYRSVKAIVDQLKNDNTMGCVSECRRSRPNE